MDDLSYAKNVNAAKSEDASAAPETTCEEANRSLDDLSINIGGPGPGQMSRQEIEESLTQIINGIEDKRREDMKIVDDAAKEIMAQAKKSCEILEEKMLELHRIKSKELDEELNRLVNILNNIKTAEVELDTSKMSLHALCKEIQKSLLS